MLLGALDRLEHRREDLVAVAQDVDAVAFGCRNADDAFDRAPYAFGRVGLRLRRLGTVGLVFVAHHRHDDATPATGGSC